MAERGIPYDLVTPLGTLEFNRWSAGEYMRFDEVDGMDAAKLRHEILELAQADGAIVPAAYREALYPAFKGAILFDSLISRAFQADLMRAYLGSLADTDGTLRWSPSEYPATTNLVANGGFETDTTGWSSAFTASISRSTSLARFGAASLEVDCAAVNDGAFKDVAGAASTLYTVSAWVYCPVAMTIGLDLSDFVDFISASTQVAVPAGVWTRLVASGTTDATAALNVFVSSKSGAGTFYVDGVQLETQPIATPYVETDGAIASRSAGPRQRTVRLFDGPELGQGPRLDPFTFGLVAGDPLAYSVTEQTSADITANGAAVAVDNGGLAPTWPKIRIYGAITNPIVKNNTTGKRIELDSNGGLTIADGAHVEIDTNPRAQTIILSTDGSSKIAHLDRAVSTFFALAVGTNQIELDGTSPSGAVKARVLHRDAWWG